MHSERLLEHFRNPRNVGDLPPPAIVIDAENPACGDRIRLSAVFQDGRVAEVRYRIQGCTASIAAGSALTELMLGCTPAELAAITAADVEEATGGLTAESKHAAVLCVDAVKALLSAKAAQARRSGTQELPD